MPLTGIEIYKFLPKTNCKKCGFPTCLAFAMKLAQKGAELSACPDVSEEAKQKLEAAARPPIRLVTIGAGDKKLEVGNEVVLFRHEKTFYHQPGLMVRIKDTEAEGAGKLIDDVNRYSVERVGINMTLNGFAIENASGSTETFAKAADFVRSKTTFPLVLMSADPSAMSAALDKVASVKPLIYAANAENSGQMIDLAKKHGCPLALAASGPDLSALATLAEQANKAGLEDLVLDPGTRGFADSLASLTQIRRLALKKSFQPLGYPIITFPGQGAANLEEEVLLAGQHIAKYAGVVVLDHFSASIVYPLLTLRLNIYTDPQKPIQVTPGIYPLGSPKESSPILITTNFSLTYFSVAGEVESSGFPSWLLVADTEGLSVLTSWAAGKFDAEKIAKTVKGTQMEEKVNHRSLVIPGAVAVLHGEVEEELPGWKIMVGPREAIDIGSFLKRTWSAG
ncbi:MAG: acetyl-CoA decarbonylase/synthase complex subunit gamma [Chloroflexi bacterium]|nr:acetyl-CoA decarbonylase/synthase complex subunit gamma [Chloroflexota bacterium]